MLDTDAALLLEADTKEKTECSLFFKSVGVGQPRSMSEIKTVLLSVLRVYHYRVYNTENMNYMY